MKSKILFPHQFKRIGWILLIPSTILGALIIFFDLKFKFLESEVFTIYAKGITEGSQQIFGFERGNYASTIVGVVFLIGAIFVAFSKEKFEDEFIAKTRLESLVWAIYVNYGILILCFLLLFNIEFIFVMLFNMFTILIFFIIRFYYMLHRAKKSLSYEK